MTWKHIEEFVNNPTITLENQQYTQLPEEISEASKNYYMYGANTSSVNKGLSSILTSVVYTFDIVCCLGSRDGFDASVK